MARFPYLFEPWQVGSMRLRNRVVAAPITKYGLLPSPADELETIAAKARGGAALIVVGSIAVNDTDLLIYHEASSLDGHKKPYFNEVVSVIHQYGAKAEAQLLHCGMWADVRGTRAPVVGSTDTVLKPGRFRGLEGIEGEQIMDGRTVHALDEAGMDAVCEDYVRSALAAKRMGFDVVMLHFAHGWLPAQFLSPFFNHRDDGFGGSLDNRARFPRMIVRRVREAVGPDFPIDVRIGAREYVEGGLELQDVVRFVQMIEDDIDLVHVSSGLDKLLGPTTYVESPSVYPHLVNVEFARAVRSAVRIPVVTVGGITLPDEADRALERGDADAVALGRALIADPDWPNKARTGPQERIRPCLRCDSCYSVATDGVSQGCAVNPEYTRALRLAVEHARRPQPKTVVIVGGGPAGMNAAVVAAGRGHCVTLLESSGTLGGLLNVAHDDAVKQDMWAYREHLVAEVAAAGVDVRLDTPATPEAVRALAPDELVVAVGSEPVTPPIPGADLGHVMNVLEAHARIGDVGRRVAVIGAGPSGCEMALALLRSGREVSLIEQAPELLAGGNLLYRGAIERLFADSSGLDVLTATRCTRITTSHVETSGPAGERRIAVDTVIHCAGMAPRRALADEFFGLVYDTKFIGDCVAPRRINEAAHEGYFAGLRM